MTEFLFKRSLKQKSPIDLHLISLLHLIDTYGFIINI